MVITGCMMQFYKSVPAVVFWQVRQPRAPPDKRPEPKSMY
jgi:hypothetical protein